MIKRANIRVTLTLVASLLLAIGLSAEAAPIEVIYTEISGHPTAQVPGSPGAEFTSMLSLYGSPNGHHWIFKGFTTPSTNDVIMVGTGAIGVAVAKEGDVSPIPPLTYEFFDSDCGTNDVGQYVFGARLQGGSTATDEVLIKFDGVSLAAAVREGDPAPGLVDPLGAGDELFGNSLNSASLLDDGTVTFKADIIQNIHSDYESACYIGNTPVIQEGTNNGTDTFDGFIGLSGNTFTTDVEGDNWIVEADVQPGIGSVEAVVVNGQVEIRDGDTLGSLTSPVDAVSAVAMSGKGDWYARGDNVDDSVWAVRNGTLIAATGWSITTGSTETYANSLLTSAGNNNGDFIISGATDNPDPDLDSVIVLNNETVVVRENDPVDLNGNGLNDDDTFINTFSPNDVILSGGRTLYFFATLRDGTGTSLGDAFLFIRICPGDLDGDGYRNLTDFTLFAAAYGSQVGDLNYNPDADLDGDGFVNVTDFTIFAGYYLQPCP